MLAVDVLWEYVNGSFVIPTWEIIFYATVMSLYALMGRLQSCLMNSFAFSFHWGFMYLLPKAFSANGLSHSALIAYAVCGLWLYAMMAVAFLRQDAKRAK